MSKSALSQRLHISRTVPVEPSSTGIIVSVLSDGHIRVLRDGRKTVCTYSPDFWIKKKGRAQASKFSVPTKG